MFYYFREPLCLKSRTSPYTKPDTHRWVILDIKSADNSRKLGKPVCAAKKRTSRFSCISSAEDFLAATESH